MIHPSLRRKKPIARTSRPRRKRKGSRAAMKRECDRLFSLFIRKRDGRCQTCPKTVGLQCAHGFSRRYIGTRLDPENAFALCAGCHYRYTLDPLGWDEWLRGRMGDRYEWIRARALMVGTKPDYSALLLWLESA